MDRGSVTQNARLASVAPTEKSRLDDIGCTEAKLTNMLIFVGRSPQTRDGQVA